MFRLTREKGSLAFLTAASDSTALLPRLFFFAFVGSGGRGAKVETGKTSGEVLPMVTDESDSCFPAESSFLSSSESEESEEPDSGSLVLAAFWRVASSSESEESLELSLSSELESSD